MLIFQPLIESHDRKSFDCGVPQLNEFLQKTARQHRDKGLSNTYILVDEDYPVTIVGFFTLSFLEVEIEKLPIQYSRKLPNKSRLPAAKLVRLAVGKDFHGKGYGALLLAEAIKRVISVINMAGAVTGFFVDAKDTKARSFYLHFGFIPLLDDQLKLFLPLKSLLLFPAERHET